MPEHSQDSGPRTLVMNMPVEQTDAVLESLPTGSSVAKPRFAAQLPLDPVIKIRPASFWENIDFSELWAHREVLYFLMWRDLKVRYKQTILGAAWVVVQPVLMTVVFTVFLEA